MVLWRPGVFLLSLTARLSLKAHDTGIIRPKSIW